MSKYKEDVESYIFAKTAGETENSEVENLEDIANSVWIGDTLENHFYNERYNQIKSIDDDNLINNVNWDIVTQIEQDFHKQRLGVESGQLIWYTSDAREEYVKWCAELGIRVWLEGDDYIGWYLGTDENGQIKVESKSDGTFSNLIGGTKGSYVTTTACCAPDLTGFSSTHTYYVLYDTNKEVTENLDDGYPITTSKPLPIYEDAPEGWYDYGASAKKWANIRTVSNGQISYFTWIPRYEYKINDVDVKSIENLDIDINFIDVSKTTASEGYYIPDAFQTTKSNGEVVQLAGIWVSKYEISDPERPNGFLTQSTENSITVKSFTTDFESKGSGKEKLENFEVTVIIDNKTVKGTLPITVDGLNAGTSYKVEAIIDVAGIDTITVSRNVFTTAGSVADLTAPDFGYFEGSGKGFNEDNTFIVNFGEKADEPTIDRANDVLKNHTTSLDITYDGKTYTKKIIDPSKDQGLTVENWYNYEDKKWANIITYDGNNQAAYWVWIPRYEYRVNKDPNGVDIVFIAPTQTIADSGYEIPDAFNTVDNSGNTVNLSGIWVSKYEMQEIAIPSGFTTRAVTGSDGNGFMIDSITYNGDSKKGSMKNYGTMKIFNVTDGGTKGTEITSGISYNGGSFGSTTKVYTGTSVTGLTQGKSYIVEWYVPFEYIDITGNTQTTKLTQTVFVPTNSTPNAPDLEQFGKTSSTTKTVGDNTEPTWDNTTSYVYYVLYDTTKNIANDDSAMYIGDRVTFSDGKAGNIPTNTADATWYDYDKKIWANIIVSKNDLSSYQGKGKKITGIPDTISYNVFVWVPRYMYKIDGKTISTIFTSSSSPSGDYKIPDAFNIVNSSGTTVNLSGIWVGKYEVKDN